MEPTFLTQVLPYSLGAVFYGDRPGPHPTTFPRLGPGFYRGAQDPHSTVHFPLVSGTQVADPTCILGDTERTLKEGDDAGWATQG